MNQPCPSFHGHKGLTGSPLCVRQPTRPPPTRWNTGRSRKTTSALHFLNNLDRLRNRFFQSLPGRDQKDIGTSACRTWSRENDGAKPQSDFSSLFWRADGAGYSDAGQPAQALWGRTSCSKNHLERNATLRCSLTWTDASKSDDTS